MLRLIWLTIVVCFGGCLFGYDSGVIGGVLTFESFSEHFRYTGSEETNVESIAVGIQQAGAFVGSLAISPVTKKYGRRWVIAACGLVFIVGVILEVIPSHKIGLFYAGRVICGLGMGGSSTIVPTYLSEMAPKEHRGRLGSCYQLFYTIGIFMSYWIDYGVKFMEPSTAQWQIPVSIQMVPAGLMAFGMLTTKESVRWLVMNDRLEEAWSSLTWVRGKSDANVCDEFEEIKEGVLLERRATEGFSYKELFETKNFTRLLTGFAIFMCQQSTGATAIAYFSPQFFSLLVGAGGDTLLLSGIFGAVKVAACLTFVLLIAERFGRKLLLLSGSGLMCACMVTTAAVIKSFPPEENQDGITSSGIATVALLYLNIIIYNASWGPLPWPCVAELFPNRIRDPGIAFGVSAQWLWNLVYSFATPYMMDDMGGWGVFLFYGIVDIFTGLFAWYILKETRNKTLEEIEAMYNQEMADARKKNEEIRHVENVEPFN